MSTADPFHYPAQVFNLLVDAISLINKSKRDVLVFFQGAGVKDRDMGDVAARVHADPNAMKKHEIARTILTRLNASGDRALRERREVVKRVVEFENFGACWPNDVLKAKGLIAELSKAVNAHDTFARIDQEREREAEDRRQRVRKELQERDAYRARLAAIASDLTALFGMADPHTRGKALESVLNRLFAMQGLLIREAFAIQAPDGEGVLCQIDGVVEFDGHAYLVEMKWHKDPLGVADVAQPLVRVFNRGDVRGLIISASGFTAPAIAQCRDALSQKVVVLCKLSEIVGLLEVEADVFQFLRTKVHYAEIDKVPLHEVSAR